MTKQILIGGGVIAIVCLLVGGFLGASIQGDLDNKNFAVTLTAIAPTAPSELMESRFQAEATPSATVSPTPTTQTLWSCVAISGYVPNAYQAILLAGNPNIWEHGPFRLVKQNGSEIVVQTRPELALVHFGEQVCVQTASP